MEGNEREDSGRLPPTPQCSRTFTIVLLCLSAHSVFLEDFLATGQGDQAPSWSLSSCPLATHSHHVFIGHDRSTQMHGSLGRGRSAQGLPAGEDGTLIPRFLVGCHTEIHLQARRGGMLALVLL